MCISNNSKVLLIAKMCIEMYGNSMMLLLGAIMLKANTAPNSDCLYCFVSVRQDLGVPIRLQNVNDITRLKFSTARMTLFVELSSPR